MTRGVVVQGGKIVDRFSVPAGTREAPRLPQGPLPPDSVPFHLQPRADGLAVDSSPETYARKGWSPARWNPFRARFAEVAEFDERASRLEARQADTTGELVALREQLGAVQEEDRQTLASWVEDPAGSARPLPVAPKIEQTISELEHEQAALTVALHRVLDAKTEYVVSHRGRLAREAAKARHEAVRTLEAAIGAVEAARDEAVATVEVERWAQEFPGAEADAASLRLSLVRGGRILKAVPEITSPLAAQQLLEILRRDAGWLNNLLADQQQKNDEGPNIRETAVWEASEEGNAALNREKQRIRESLAPRNVARAGWDADGRGA